MFSFFISSSPWGLFVGALVVDLVTIVIEVFKVNNKFDYKSSNT